MQQQAANQKSSSKQQPLVVKVGTLALAAALAACGSSDPAQTAAGAANPSDSTTTPSQTSPSDTGSFKPVTSASMVVKESATAKGHDASVANIVIQDSDGVDVYLTVFYPKVAAGKPAPLLLHSHGFGGNRIETLETEDSVQTSEIGVDAMQLAYNQKNPVEGRQGWYVISYDQRGHGDSGGNVTIMDPRFEGKAFTAVLNWAEKNLSNLAYREESKQLDPVIGTIGRSYGGAFQLMGAGMDKRIDAMVPGGTWYDLRYSLNPNGVPKTTYLDGLVAGGLQSNRGRYDTFLFDGLARANTTNEVSGDIVNRLGSNGAVSYCDPSQNFVNGLTMKSDIPAFFVQGATDVLFNLNEGIQNFECYRKVNPNSKLLMVKYGHLLDGLKIQQDPRPALASVGAKYAFNESKVWLATDQKSCPSTLDKDGRCVIDLKHMMFQFLVENLIGAAEAKSDKYLGFGPVPVPEVAAVLEDNRADPTAVVISGKGAARPDVTRQAAFSEPTAPAQINTGITDVFGGLASTQAPAQLSRTTFVPLSNGKFKGCVVGSPMAKVDIKPVIPNSDGSPVAPIVYVGLGVKRADGTTTVLHDQITPVKGYGVREIKLPGVSVKLAEGEELVLNLSGYNPVFLTSFSRVPTPVSVSAQVALPVSVTDAAGVCK